MGLRTWAALPINERRKCQHKAREGTLQPPRIMTRSPEGAIRSGRPHLLYSFYSFHLNTQRPPETTKPETSPFKYSIQITTLPMS